MAVTLCFVNEFNTKILTRHTWTHNNLQLVLQHNKPAVMKAMAQKQPWRQNQQLPQPPRQCNGVQGGSKFDWVWT